MYFDPLLYDGGAEWLYNIINSTNLKSQTFVLRFTSSCHKDYWDLIYFGVPLQPSTNFVSVNIWHRDVEKDNVGR